MTIPVVRKRTKHAKTRTGCKTCRVRRIKCDEERPACRKCTSTGRDCSGYEINLALLRGNEGSQDRKLLPRANDFVREEHIMRPLAAVSSGLSSMEAHAFDFFREQTMCFLPGCPSTTKWEIIAMQLSHTEPALMCAIVAVGSMHQARTTRSTGYIMPHYAPEQFRFAMEHYSRAMRHVQHYIKSIVSKGLCNSVEVVLVACLMFVCVELLNSNNTLAIRHLRTGLKILHERSHDPISKYQDQRRIMIKSEPRSTLDVLSEIYVQLDCVAATTFGQERPLLLPYLDKTSADDPCPMPTLFQGFDDARRHLTVLASAIFCAHGELLRLAEEEIRVSRDVSALDENQLECLIAASSRLVDLGKKPQLQEQIRALEQSVAAWSSAFARSRVGSESNDHQFNLLLEIQFFDVWLTSSTWLDKTELMGDRFTTNYNCMLRRIEEYLEWTFQDPNYLDAPRAGGHLRTFALGQGVLIPLFTIAARCRDTLVRRRALMIPSRLHIQESMIDSALLAAVMERIVDVEEDVARSMNGFAPDRPLTCDEVPEAARLWHANLSMRHDGGEVGRFIFCHRAQAGDKELTLKEYEFTLGNFGLPIAFPKGAFPSKMA